MAEIMEDMSCCSSLYYLDIRLKVLLIRVSQILTPTLGGPDSHSSMNGLWLGILSSV